MRKDDRATASFAGRPKDSLSKSRPANAKRDYEHYLVLANCSAATGDAIESENYYQHAEHYFRLMRETAA